MNLIIRLVEFCDLEYLGFGRCVLKMKTRKIQLPIHHTPCVVDSIARETLIFSSQIISHLHQDL